MARAVELLSIVIKVYRAAQVGADRGENPRSSSLNYNKDNLFLDTLLPPIPDSQFKRSNRGGVFGKILERTERIPFLIQVDFS